MTDLSILSDRTSLTAVRLMDIAQLRQKVISNNLANANTPGYIRQDVTFKEQLGKMLEAGDMEGIKQFDPERFDDEAMPARRDGNNIIPPMELNAMMQNGLFYNLLTRSMSTKLKILKLATQGT